MRTPWKVILAFVGVFVAGGVCGGYVALRVAKESRPPRPTAQMFAAQMMERLAKQLKLTDEQKAQISPIVQRAQEDMIAQRRDHFIGVTRASEKMNAEIGVFLTPEQKTKLEELTRKIHERVERERERGDGGGRGPGE